MCYLTTMSYVKIIHPQWQINEYVRSTDRMDQKKKTLILKKKIRLCAILSTTNPTQSWLQSNIEQHGERPVTKCPCDDMALKTHGSFPHFGYLCLNYIKLHSSILHHCLQYSVIRQHVLWTGYGSFAGQYDNMQYNSWRFIKKGITLNSEVTFP